MAAPVIYFAGGEDIDFNPVAGGVLTTTAGRFRSAYARCALQTTAQPSAANDGAGWIGALAWSAATFWSGARVWSNSINATVNTTPWIAYSSDGLPRLRIRCSSNLSTTFVLEKIDASGAVTQLGASFTLTWASSPATPDKWDVFTTYGAAGEVDIYINNVLAFQFLGDTTTNSITALANLAWGHLGSGAVGTTAWSEIIVSDTDTRSFSLQTLAPVANGNTHNFDTGTPAAANVNEVTLSQATFDGSSVAGQIDQYTIPAIVAGAAIVAVGVSAQLARGTTGPTKADLNVRSGGADAFSADLTLAASWADFQNWWMTDPATAVTWTSLPTNIGIKSVA